MQHTTSASCLKLVLRWNCNILTNHKANGSFWLFKILTEKKSDRTKFFLSKVNENWQFKSTIEITFEIESGRPDSPGTIIPSYYLYVPTICLVGVGRMTEWFKSFQQTKYCCCCTVVDFSTFACITLKFWKSIKSIISKFRCWLRTSNSWSKIAKDWRRRTEEDEKIQFCLMSISFHALYPHQVILQVFTCMFEFRDLSGR